MNNLKQELIQFAELELQRRQKLLPHINHLPDGVLFDALFAFETPAVVAEWLLSQAGGWNRKCILELLEDPEERGRAIALLRLIEPRPVLTVKVVKIAATSAAGTKPGNWSDSEPGQQNQNSPPIGFEVVGVFISPPIPGEMMRIARSTRNGMAVAGEFISSPVKEVIAVTGNSMYRITAAKT